MKTQVETPVPPKIFLKEKEYAQTIPACGHQRYRTYADVSNTQAQNTITHGQITYATSHSLPLIILLQLPSPSSRLTVSLSRDIVPVLMIPPLLQSPPPRPPMQLSLHLALSLLTQPIDTSQQPPPLEDCRMVISLLTLAHFRI
jgi:hypothetical protein